APLTITTRAVIKHTMTVSMKGSNMATSPSRTGSFVFAAAWAMADEPNPASLEKEARLTPQTSTPTAPPKAAFSEKARWKMREKAPGMAEKLAKSTATDARM